MTRLPELVRILLAALLGIMFATGMVFIIDTGIWQQPVGWFMVSISVAFVVRILIELPDEFRRVLYGLDEDDDFMELP